MQSTSFCEPFRDAIELRLSRDRNAVAIWQDLVSESGFRGGYQTVKREVNVTAAWAVFSFAADRFPATCLIPARGVSASLR